MMPKAFAVSAKSNDFDENGDEKTIDYMKMLKIVKSFGYTGYIGVEYEGKDYLKLKELKQLEIY
jgi:hydroxypyruvate isomerase